MDYITKVREDHKEIMKSCTFGLRGQARYYHGNQMAIFKRNADKIKNTVGLSSDNISFSEYSINAGYNQYCGTFKRFNSKQEMLGYVAGYNEANGWY